MGTKVEVRNVSRSFSDNQRQVYALRDVSFKVGEGGLVVIIGSSG